VEDFDPALPPDLPRKSVSYQPEPFNWKAAAVISLTNVSAPHAGQVFNGASDIFCSVSKWCPHALQ
jgi:hypothetical protein